MSGPAGAARQRLAERQEAVLDALLRGEVPTGFDPAAAGLTARVLLRKRSDAALHAAPELAHLPGWREAFHRHALSGPSDGCAHDDVALFLAGLDDATDPGGDWRRLHAVHDGRRTLALVRLAGRPTLVVGIGGRTWHLTRRRARRRATEGARP